MCPTDAIKEAKRQHVITKRRCDGCGQCVPFCPVAAIVAPDGGAKRQTYAEELAALLERPPR